MVQMGRLSSLLALCVGLTSSCLLLVDLDQLASTAPAPDGTAPDGPVDDARDAWDARLEATCGNDPNDARNCGACGHDCIDSPCVDGHCTPKILLSSLSLGTYLVVAGGYAYVVDQSPTPPTPKHTLRRVAVVGGLPEALPINNTCASSGVEGLTVDGEFAFFGCGINSLYRVRVSDLVLEEVRALAASSIVVERSFGGAVYMQLNNTIARSPRTAFDAGEVVKNVGVPIAAVRPMGERIFFIVSGDAGAIESVPIDGGPRALIAPSSQPRGLDVDDAGLVWADDADGGTLWSLDQGVLTGHPLSGVQCVVAAGGVTYVATAGSGATEGAILRVPRGAGGSRLELARGEQQPTAIASDDKFVYWTTKGIGQSGELRRVAR